LSETVLYNALIRPLLFSGDPEITREQTLLVRAVSTVHGCGKEDLRAARRQRMWAKPPAQLAYLARGGDDGN
jgi:hypothetical protein